MALRMSPLLALIALTGAPAVVLGDDASLGKDLKATIALQGMACDQLVQAKRNKDSDYTASCKDGNRYHVYVNAQGRVIVQKL